MVRSHRHGLAAACLLAVLTLSLGLAAAWAGAAKAETPAPSASATVVRELLAERTATSTTYLLSDGTYRSTSYAAPIFYRDEAGAWQSIDPTLIPDGSLGTYATTSAPVTVTFADEAPGQKPVTVESGSYDVTLNLVGCSEDGKLVLGDSATYFAVAPDTNVTYTALGDGVKEVIELASNAAPSVFTYRLTHAGLTLRQDDAGQWGLYAPGAARPVLYLGAMNVCDSSKDAAGEPAWCDAAQMSVAPGVDASTVSFSVPRAWMNDPARVYPLKVDPGLTTAHPTDTYISAGYPGTPYGSSDTLFCGQVSTASGNCKSLVKFPNLDSAADGGTAIPDGAHISSATFSIRQFWQPTTHNDTVNVGRVSNDSTNWGEASTWNSSTINVESLSNVDAAACPQWVNVDCPGVIQAWERDEYANKGFIVHEGNTALSYGRKFRSCEYTDDAYRPRMNIFWEQPTANVSWDRGTAAYRVGDTVTVTVNLTGVADTSQVTTVRMGLNRTDSDLTRRRGLLGWYSSPPTDAGWVSGGNGFYWFRNPDTQGSDHITPLLSQCSRSGGTWTFIFKLNDDTVDPATSDFYSDFGDVQSNALDTFIGMSAGSGNDWSSGWVNNATNIAVQPTAPQHATSDLGPFAGHAAQATLDEQSLRVSTSDLAIASWGPQADVARSYASSRTTSSLTAPGWRFGFQRNLNSVSGGAPSASDNFVNYVDEAGDTFVFLKRAGAYLAPPGFSAVLAPSGSSWTLTVDGGLVSTFDSSGKLTSEKDRNNQTVTYAYAGTQLTSITAANGQAITLSYTSGKLSSASYATTSGTRQVSYAVASPWRVTYYPSQSVQRKVLYGYGTSTRLTSLTQEDWPGAGQTAHEDFAYDSTSGALTNVYLPGYNATSRPDARLNLTYDTSVSATDNMTSATLNHYDAAGAVNSHDLLTLRDASPRMIEAKTYVGSSLSLTRGVGWNGVYCVDSATTTPAGGAQAKTTYDYASDPSVAAFGKVILSTDAGQHATTYAYTYPVTDPTGRLKSETTPNGTTTYDAYDAVGNLTAVTKTFSGSSDKSRTEYAYDSCGRVTCEKQLISGTVTKNADDTFTVTGGVWAETDYSNFAASGEPQTTVTKAVKLTHNGNAQDLTKTTSYDAFGNRLTDGDWGGRTTETSAYDIAGRALTSLDAAGVTTHTACDALGNATESYQTAAGTSKKANWTVTTYDPAGHDLTVTTKLSDASGNPTTQSVVTNTYDGAGNELTSSDSRVGGQPEKWVYDAQGNVTEHWAMGVANSTDAYRSTRTSYDEENRQTGESAPGDSVTPGPVGGNDPTAVGGSRTVYNDLGQTSKEISPDKCQVTYAYDGDGNQTSAASTASGTTTSTYGIDDRLVSQTEQSTFATVSAYDMLGRVTGATGGSQSQTQTEYNTLGWVLQTVDANGVTDAKTYDVHGNVTDEAIGTAGTTHSTYDAANNLLTQTDPNGNVLTNTYDVFGNVAEEKHQDCNAATVKDVATSYDSLGRSTSESESVSGRSRTWTYPVNTAGGVQETLSYDSTPLTRTVVACNARGMETSSTTTIAAGTTLTRSVADSSSGRDRADRWTQAQVQLSGLSALTLNRSFDDADRESAQSGAGFSSAGSYSYNASSGLKGAQNLPLSLGGTASDSYTYSSDGRLHTWNGSGATYTFSAAGNLTGDTGTGTTFSYDSANRLASSVRAGTTTYYGWDAANAWRTSQGTQTDPAQRPIHFTYVKSGASTSNGRMTRYQNTTTSMDASYTYDASGQRAKSTVTVSGTTTTTNFTYDGITLLKLSATQGSTTWRIDYLYDEDGVPYGGVYRSPATSTSPTCFTVITNDHGDVLELLDANGAAFAAYRYDPWGLPLASGTTNQATTLIDAATAANIASRQVLRYASYAYDPESGLYYCSARYYDPATRQWTTGDPAKADGEESAYQYCGGEPVGKDDPTGEDDRQYAYMWGWFGFYPLNWYANYLFPTCGYLEICSKIAQNCAWITQPAYRYCTKWLPNDLPRRGWRRTYALGYWKSYERYKTWHWYYGAWAQKAVYSGWRHRWGAYYRLLSLHGYYGYLMDCYYCAYKKLC